MKSKLALIAVLALGVLIAGTGSALAASGISGSGSAGSAQYAPEEDDNDFCVENGDGSGSAGEGEAGCEEPCVEEGSGSAGESGESASGSGENCAHQETQPTESSSSLPYTGFSAIPMLLIGLGLVGAGVLMRTRRRSSHFPA